MNKFQNQEKNKTKKEHYSKLMTGFVKRTLV